MNKKEIDQTNSALNIMRRMPPSKIDFNVSGLINLMPHLTDELLQRIDVPLKTAKDPKEGNKLYLLCDYNRDGDSNRSPWSNNYYPPLEDGFYPSDYLRRLEDKCNHVFDSYREQYFQGGVSSVYLWDLDEEEQKDELLTNFAGAFMIKKEIVEEMRSVNNGSWNSIHIVEVTPQGKSKATYTLTTTVMLVMVTSKSAGGSISLSGSLTRQAKPKTLDVKSENDHVINIGKMIEDMEIDIRAQLESIYIQKTREIVNSIRKPFDGKTSAGGSVATGQASAGLMGELNSNLKGKGVALPGLGGKKN
jgi:capping protein beta